MKPDPPEPFWWNLCLEWKGISHLQIARAGLQPAFQQGFKSTHESLQAFLRSTPLARNLGCSWLHKSHLSGGVLGWSFQSHSWESSPSVFACVSPFRECSPCPHTRTDSAGCFKALCSFRVLCHSLTQPANAARPCCAPWSALWPSLPPAGEDECFFPPSSMCLCQAVWGVIGGHLLLPVD